MNWYSILMLMMFSPIGWIINGLLLSVFIFSTLKYNMAANVYRRVLLTVDARDPRPADTIAIMMRQLKTQPFIQKKEFWFIVMSLSAIALIITIGFPMFCTFTSFTTYCP